MKNLPKYRHTYNHLLYKSNCLQKYTRIQYLTRKYAMTEGKRKKKKKRKKEKEKKMKKNDEKWTTE